MKKLIGIMCILALMANSCDKNCQDCGPTGYTRFYMINSTNEPKTVTWFGNTTLPSNVVHEFVITNDEKKLLYESTVGLSITPSLEQAISTRPFGSTTPYDSVRISSASDIITYTKKDCELIGNPLCEKNYELLKSVDTKDEKIKEWEFKIE